MTAGGRPAIGGPKLSAGLKQNAFLVATQKDGVHAIPHRSDLELLAQQLPRGIERARGSAMIEASLGLFSLAIFAAHAVDAYRTL